VDQGHRGASGERAIIGGRVGDEDAGHRNRELQLACLTGTEPLPVRSRRRSALAVAVAGGRTFARLDAGRDSTCGITTSNEAYCWGANGLGQLGNGPGEPADLSRVPLAVRFSEISASDGEHTCALTPEGSAVFCWGRNDVGQPGNGDATGSNTARLPVPAPRI